MHRQGDGENWEYLTPEVRPTKTNKQKLVAAKLNLKKRSSRPPVLHFIWKGYRLTLCLGGTVIAAWPQGDADGRALGLVQTKMIGEHIEPLSRDQRKIRSLALRLREALVKAEDGPRRKSAYRQRVRIDRLFKLGVYAPAKNPRVKATWRCNCDSPQVYALSVESCEWCQKKAPRQRKLRLPDTSR